VIDSSEYEAPAAQAAGASFPCLIHPNSSLEDVGTLPFLPRSALACYWSISHLVRSSSFCSFWTITAVEVMPDSWFGQAHINLIRAMSNAARSGRIPRNWGGVRVFEPHPGGHGLHAHWVMRGRMPWDVVQDLAKSVGLGRVHVSPKKVTVKSAGYLALYLSKSDKLRGVRQWANIGTYDGIGKRDIVQDSERIREIKAWLVVLAAQGIHRFRAYRMAVQNVDDGKFAPGSDPF